MDCVLSSHRHVFLAFQFAHQNSAELPGFVHFEDRGEADVEAASDCEGDAQGCGSAEESPVNPCVAGEEGLRSEEANSRKCCQRDDQSAQRLDQLPVFQALGNSAQGDVENRAVEAGHDGGGKREVFMALLENEDEHRVQPGVHENTDGGDDHGNESTINGRERRLDDLDQGVENESDGVILQGHRSLGRFVAREFPALKENGNDR